MSAAPLIDIVLPYWGAPEHLYTAVASVREQHDPAWRLTVIDDAYPSDDVPRHFADLDDDRVRYLRNDSNLGITANFQRAADLAEAPLTVFLGSDDRLEPDYVARIRQAADAHSDVDVFAPAVRVIDEQGRRYEPLADRVKRILTPRTTAGPVRFDGEAMVSTLSRGNWLYWPSLAIRTKRVKSIPFRLDLPIILDMAFLLDIAFDGGSLLYLNGPPMFEYRRHRSSLSQKAIIDGVRFRDEARFHHEIAQRAQRAGWRSAAFWARLRPSSRLHAAVSLPKVVGARDGSGTVSALSNAFGR